MIKMVLCDGGWLQETSRMPWPSSPRPFAALQEANRAPASELVLARRSTESDARKGEEGGTLVGEMLRWLFLFCLNPARLAIAKYDLSRGLPANLESRIPYLKLCSPASLAPA
jgi:hypothetical protein